LICTKEIKLNFLEKIEQRAIESSKKHLHSAYQVSSKSSEKENKKYSRKLVQGLIVPQMRVIVPSNLPKFRKGQTEEPTEFLEAFERIMEAHTIATHCYLHLVPLCLDIIDK
jgi:hypothetical protein